MQKVVLKTSKRTASGKKIHKLRQDGFIPGIVYGQGNDPVLVQVDEKVLGNAYQQAGTSKLVELEIDQEKPKNVLFHEVQLDPLTQRLLHFDLYTVRMDEKIKTEVPLYFTEEAPVVHEEGAVLLKNLEAVEVEALPANLPENIEVNLAVIQEIGQAIHIKDLNVPEGVTILGDPEELIVKADPPRSEEELAELEEELEEGVESEVESEKGTEADAEESAESPDQPEAADNSAGDTEDKE